MAVTYLDNLQGYTNSAIAKIAELRVLLLASEPGSEERQTLINQIVWYNQLAEGANDISLGTTLQLRLLTLLVDNARLNPYTPVDIINLYQPIIPGSTPGSILWGGIGGNINDQTDLIAKFNTYLPLAGGIMTGNIQFLAGLGLDASVSGASINFGTTLAGTVTIGRVGQNVSMPGTIIDALWGGQNITVDKGGLGALDFSAGADGQVPVKSGTGYAWYTIPAAGTGNVVGPSDSVDNSVVRWDGTTGELIKDGVVIIDETGNVTGLGTLNTHTIQGGTASTFALYTNRLDAFAATTSAQLIAKITDPQGTGRLVFATSPSLTTPDIGVATGTALTLTGGLVSGVSSSVAGLLTVRNATNANTQTIRGTAAVGSRIFDLPIADPTGTQYLTGSISGGVITTTWATITALVNPMDTLGDIIYGGALGSPTKLSGNTTTTPKVLISTGSGGLATAPVFDILTSGMIPNIAISQVTALTAALSGKVSTNLMSGKILIGNLSDLAAPQTPYGDWTIAYDGQNTIGANKVLFSKFQQATGPQLLVGTPDILGAQDFRQITLDPGSLYIDAFGVMFSTGGGGGSGTVTHTVGALTSNSIVLGNGGADIKVGSGFTTDGISKITLGVAGSSVGGVVFTNATSGTIEIRPVTGALATTVLSMPATTGTLALVSQIPTVTPAALTKTDDTNVTLTLGGTPASSLLQAVSLTLGWTGTLADARIASASTWNAKQSALSGTGYSKWAGASVSYLTPTQVTADLNLFATGATTQGLVPGSNSVGATYYLDATGTWSVPAGGGGGTSLSGLTAATGTNTINNATFAQEWQWNTLAGATGLALSSTSTAAASGTQVLFSSILSGANATSSQTTYAAKFSNTHTGTTATNIAAQFDASGGDNNWAMYLNAGGMYAALNTYLDIANGAGNFFQIRSGGNSILQFGPAVSTASGRIQTTASRVLFDIVGSGNVNMEFEVLNTGSFNFNNGKAVRFYNTGSTFYTGLVSANTTSVTYTLPVADGTSGYVLSTNGSGVLSWIAAGAGGGAATSLNNLSSVSINASLIPQTGIDLGAAATAWRDLYLYGGGTFGSHSIKVTGTPTGNRTITIPDVTDTIAVRGTAQTFTAAQTVSLAGSTTTGQLTIGGTTNIWIDLGTTGVGAPSFTTRSLGAKLVLYKQLTGGATADCAIGMEANGPWFGSSANTQSIFFYAGTTRIVTFPGTGGITITQTATSAVVGAKGIVYTGAVNTNQTASAEIESCLFTLAGRQWATGAITLQREFHLTTPTYSFVGASTITDAVTFQIDGPPTAGTNATITRPWAARLLGNVAIGTGLHIGSSTGVVSPTAFLHIAAGVTSKAQILLETGVAPTGGALTDGVIWFDGTNLFMRIGGATKTFTII